MDIQSSVSIRKLIFFAYLCDFSANGRDFIFKLQIKTPKTRDNRQKLQTDVMNGTFKCVERKSSQHQKFKYLFTILLTPSRVINASFKLKRLFTAFIEKSFLFILRSAANSCKVVAWQQVSTSQPTAYSGNIYFN